MAKTSAFLKEFFKEKKTVGSVVPSWRFLQRKMVSKIDFESAECIVELGPGEGCISRRIVDMMGEKTDLVLFEMNTGFVERFLQFNNPRIHTINDSAEHIGRYLQELELPKCDAIISSLPLTNFPNELREAIIDEAIRNLKPDGVYMQYQYSTTAYALLKEKFRKVKLGFTPINIPPAFVYTCYL